jgi:hypothetical protein
MIKKDVIKTNIIIIFFFPILMFFVDRDNEHVVEPGTGSTAASTPVAQINQSGNRMQSFINENLEERSLNVEIQAGQGGDR